MCDIDSNFNMFLGADSNSSLNPDSQQELPLRGGVAGLLARR